MTLKENRLEQRILANMLMIGTLIYRLIIISSNQNYFLLVQPMLLFLLKICRDTWTILHFIIY